MECGAFLDRESRHKVACAPSGRLKTRALAPERTLAKVCREAGATVRYNARPRDINVAGRLRTRAIEVIAPIVLRRPIGSGYHTQVRFHSGGDPQPGAARIDGAVCS